MASLLSTSRFRVVLTFPAFFEFSLPTLKLLRVPELMLGVLRLLYLHPKSETMKCGRIVLLWKAPQTQHHPICQGVVKHLAISHPASVRCCQRISRTKEQPLMPSRLPRTPNILPQITSPLSRENKTCLPLNDLSWKFQKS